MRLALVVASMLGWKNLLNVRSVRDAPLLAVNHLLTASAESKGTYHFPAALIEPYRLRSLIVM